ncbi:MAG: hypothetical protein K2K27_03535 [Muribaculaceae bacterium]|nr:hypothetical protein [Muribaculaceae bacterium]
MANDIIETDYSSSITEDEHKQIDELITEIECVVHPKSESDATPSLF